MPSGITRWASLLRMRSRFIVSHFIRRELKYTFSRYNYASPSRLITRLTSRNMHLLALRISGFLRLKPDAVLKHWACAKIMRAKSAAVAVPTGTSRDAAEPSTDDEVCRMIVAKFEELGGTEVSYADIARKAWEVGRPGLATKVRFGYPLCLPLQRTVYLHKRTAIGS